MDKVKPNGYISIDMFAFCLVPIRSFLAEIQKIPYLAWRIQGQGHDEKVKVMAKVNPTDDFEANSLVNMFAFCFLAIRQFNVKVMPISIRNCRSVIY